MFANPDTVRLRTDPADPLGEATDLIAVGDDLVVVDALQANVKTFDGGGALKRVWGGRGDGPGEFRAPMSVARAGHGDLAVLDGVTSAISVFAPDGTFRRRFMVPVVMATTLRRYRDGWIVFARGLRGQADDRFLDASFATAVDSLGSVLWQGLPIPRPAGAHNVESAFGAIVGNHVVAIRMAGNLAVQHDPSAGTIDTVRLAGGYVPPTWSTLEGGIPEMEAWAKEQMWALGVLILSPSEYAVKYRIGGDRYRYLFVDANAKRQIGYTETVSDNLIAVDGGVAFGAAIELAGERVIRYTVRLPRAGRKTGA